MGGKEEAIWGGLLYYKRTDIRKKKFQYVLINTYRTFVKCLLYSLMKCVEQENVRNLKVRVAMNTVTIERTRKSDRKDTRIQMNPAIRAIPKGKERRKRNIPKPKHKKEKKKKLKHKHRKHSEKFD